MDPVKTALPYRPPWILSNAYLQSYLASSRIRAMGHNSMVATQQPMLIETAGGVCLLGAYSPVKNEKAKGLVILLHGWEGSFDSTYILRFGRFMFQNGYEVFRLNFRDHGDTHHLNRDPFFATCLDEVFQGVEQAATLSKNRPVFLVGFSLGGNFVLRIVGKCRKTPIRHLARAVAISPVLDPEAATRAIDSDGFLRWYFKKKWRRSLKKKQLLYPDRFDFRDVLSLKTLRQMTEILVARYGDFDNAREYFQAYGFVKAASTQIAAPTTIITASDDPVIPVRDFYQLEPNRLMDLIVQPRGGHIGFFDTVCSPWYEPVILDRFDSAETHHITKKD